MAIGLGNSKLSEDTVEEIKGAADGEYFAEAKKWEILAAKMKDDSVKRSTWFAIAGGIVGVLGILSATVQAMKEPPLPAILRVNDSNGTVDVVSRITDGKTTYEEALNKAFAQKYVRYRESYSRPLAEEYYNAVGLLSSSAEQQEYAKWFSPKNPNSPLNLYGDTAKVKLRMKGTTFINPKVALVRYLRCEQRGGDGIKISDHSATVTFTYTAAPMSEKDREINPLGYQVTDYRTDKDSVSDTSGENACDDRKSNSK